MRKRLWWIGVLTCICSFLIISPFCYAADWDYVCSNKDGAKYYLDTSSVEKNDAYLSFWRKEVFAEPQDGEKKVIIQYEVHLAKPLEGRILQITSYDNDDNVVRNYTGPYEWKKVVPDSIFWRMTNAAMHYVQ